MRKLKRMYWLAASANHMEQQTGWWGSSCYLLCVMAGAASRWGVQKQGKAVEHRECSLSSASWEGCGHSSFCSAPSDGQSSRQQGGSTSTPSDWLSLLAKAHGIGWAREVSSKDWPMAEVAALPFSCWVATSGVEPISSESFGGGLEDGGDDVWGRGDSQGLK